jgi:hypothetical protein
MAQGREPVFFVVNRWLEDYAILNHTAIFENRPEISKYNSYISDYQPSPNQMNEFDQSINNITKYEDLVSNIKTNKGPIFGKTVSTQ